MRMPLALVLFVLCTPACSAEATCADFPNLEGEDRALLEGYAYGYVAAKMEGRPDSAVNDAVRHALSMTTKYCSKKPADKVRNVLSAMSDTAARYTK